MYKSMFLALALFVGNSLFMNVGLISTAEAATKAYPSGLLLRGKVNRSSYCDKPIGDNVVAGGYCQIYWSDLESSAGTFDFSLIDDAIASAKAYNKRLNLKGADRFKVLLRIRTGVNSPRWVKKSVGTIPWYFKSFSSSQKYKLPLFWTETYQDYYYDMMKALADRYDGNGIIGGVAASMCMTVHTEIMWNRTGRPEVRSTNIEKMRDASSPYSNEEDYECLKRQVRIHKNLWKKTPTFFGSHLYQNYDYATGDATPLYNQTITLFTYCRSQLGDRCVLGNNSLRHDENNTSSNINKAVASMGSPIYFQTNVLKHAEGEFTWGNLKKAVENGASWGALAIEMPMGWNCKKYDYSEGGCTSSRTNSRASKLSDSIDLLKENVGN